MKPIRNKTRTYRSSSELDQKLLAAADLISTDPSQLIREFIRQGTQTILNNADLQHELKKTYSLS